MELPTMNFTLSSHNLHTIKYFFKSQHHRLYRPLADPFAPVIGLIELELDSRLAIGSKLVR